ncbi:hypothetical protein [Actibacterium sp.]|uniref:hypothetical protein n=1 Tax=Actibacterium sp. TaxID=1872125 RepID=UPI003567EB10
MITKYAALAAGLLFCGAGSALALTSTDAYTIRWNYTQPSELNSIPPQPVTTGANYCQAGQTLVAGINGTFCEGLPSGKFVEADNVPPGYTGRVFRIGPGNGSGHQDFDW